MTTSNETLIAEVLERNSRKLKLAFSPENPDDPAHSNSDRELLVQSLVESARKVFSTMCGVELSSEPEAATDHSTPAFQISGIIGFSGTIEATIVVSIRNDLLFYAAEQIMGIETSEIDASVIDLTGELTNMIGGNAKERLDREGLSLSLPTVVSGDNHRVGYSSGMQTTAISLTSPHGSLTIELGMV